MSKICQGLIGWAERARISHRPDEIPDCSPETGNEADESRRIWCYHMNAFMLPI